MRASFLLVGIAACCPPEAATKNVTVAPPVNAERKDLAVDGEIHLKNVRQLTFGADNAEAYWAFGGDKLIMQTNHAPYKCDQIEELSLAGGPGKLVSTGTGRTTCSYFLKGDQEIIYASTHEASKECPTPPDMSKGYYWGLFEYDIYRANADGSNLRKLTDSPGYDAEATVCPKDGSIIFTSVRSGDPELWRMDADGKNLRQLTNLTGYDGGAFFSPDCSKIVWRTSRPQPGKELDEYKELLKQNLVKPTKMDLWVANADGTDARQVTYLPGASFAPFFYPDGKRIIFASNYLSPRGPEFDLFGIDLDGTHLERITYGESFDGFPMFSPDGKTLSFSSNRRDVVKKDGKEVYRVTGGVAGEHDTNVFVADWVDQPRAKYQPETEAADRYAEAVGFLAADAQDGRGIGSPGLMRSEDYVQKQLESIGVTAGPGGWRQSFEVVTEVKRGDKTAVSIDGNALSGVDFAPTVYSGSGSVKGAVAFAGYGIVDKDLKLDDFKKVSVKGKVAVVHRYVPPDLKKDVGVATRLGDIRHKAFDAKNAGAVAMIVVDDGEPKEEETPLPELLPGGMAEATGASSDAGMPIVVMTRKAAADLAKAKQVTVSVALEPVRTKTDNVIGVIASKSEERMKDAGVVVIGAHVDHLGMGGPDALDKVHEVHNGADDNASGVAALLETARILKSHEAELQRDVVIVAFSGEEEGDLGSTYFVKNWKGGKIAAMVNMDMVGRMRNNTLHVNGGDSAKEWHGIAEAACQAAKVECTVGGSGYGPSDHMPFYIAGVPVVFLFTGTHTDYHTATDDADKINAAGGVRAAMVAADMALAVAKGAELTYVKAPPEPMGGGDGPRRASLGTVPSYDEDPNRPPGMVLSDVVPDGPAAKAGLKGGDRIIKLDDTEIRSVNDLMFVLQGAKAGTQVKVTFVRDGKTQTVMATYGVPRARH